MKILSDKNIKNQNTYLVENNKSSSQRVRNDIKFRVSDYCFIGISKSNPTHDNTKTQENVIEKKQMSSFVLPSS